MIKRFRATIKLKNKIAKKILLFRAKWKYRNVDPDLCCCGGNISQSKPFDSICQFSGCRSAKEYHISKYVDGNK